MGIRPLVNDFRWNTGDGHIGGDVIDDHASGSYHNIIAYINVWDNLGPSAYECIFAHTGIGRKVDPGANVSVLS